MTTRDETTADALRKVQDVLAAWPKQGDYRHPHWIAKPTEDALAALPALISAVEDKERELATLRKAQSGKRKVDKKALKNAVCDAMSQPEQLGMTGYTDEASTAIMKIFLPYLHPQPSASIPARENETRKIMAQLIADSEEAQLGVAFIKWAKSRGYDITTGRCYEDNRTYYANEGWEAAINFLRSIPAAGQASVEHLAVKVQNELEHVFPTMHEAKLWDMSVTAAKAVLAAMQKGPSNEQ